jgi:hypothetical protein
MQWFLGGSGPAWYSEGMAEKIGLHRWDKGELQLGFRPQTSDEVDYWGRPRLIALAVQDKRLPRLDQVFDLDAIRFTDVENYAWSWAACEFLSTHPLTTEPFERAKKQASISTPAFSLKLKRPLREKWPVIERDWKLFIDELGYGSTAERSAITPAVITAEEFGWRASVDSSHSWQATGVTLPAGDTIEVKATGQYQIADQTRPVVSEANGVTLHYYRGRPWGELTAALLLPDGSLTPPLSVGNRRQLTFDTDGELLLRINETPREMGDNQGELSVELRLIPKRD